MVDTFNKVPPLFTIGVPAYNEEKFLPQTLDSLLQQSYKNFKVLICDDCSTDNTLSIARKYALMDNRIEVLSSERKLSFVENWNRSLSACNSPYFAWIGAHDVLHSDYFKEALDVFNVNPEVVLVYPQAVLIDIENIRGQSADSDFETIGLNKRDALIKVAKNLHFCTAIHGVFKTEVLKKLPILHIQAFDALILFLVSIYGEIGKTKNVTFFRRQVRVENAKQTEKRWEEAGMFKRTKTNHFIILSRKFISFYLRLDNDTFLNKIRFSNDLGNLLANKFGFKKKNLISRFL